MMTSSNGKLFHVTGPLWRESTTSSGFRSQRSVLWSFDVFFELHLNEWLNNLDGVDLRCRGTHYDVTVMIGLTHLKLSNSEEYVNILHGSTRINLTCLIPWYNKAQQKHCMMTSSNGNIFPVTGPLSPVPGEFPAQRPVTRSFDIFFDLHFNKP